MGNLTGRGGSGRKWRLRRGKIPIRPQLDLPGLAAKNKSTFAAGNFFYKTIDTTGRAETVQSKKSQQK